MKNLSETVSLNQSKLYSFNNRNHFANITAQAPVLILLAAGKGTRFGTEPKCIQPVNGIPLARHAVDAFRQVSASPSICIVGYRNQEVANALGDDNIFVLSENPAGGTAYAAYEAFCIPQLLSANPLVCVTMGDRIVPTETYRQLWAVHCGTSFGNQDAGEAALTLLTAQYDPPRNQSKGRILRSQDGAIIGIREQKDIEAELDPQIRQQQLELTEGNCPLYMTRAHTLHRLLGDLTNDNAQGQFYITDIVARLVKDGLPIRSITTVPTDAAYPLLCADVTRPNDLDRLERIVQEYSNHNSIS